MPQVSDVTFAIPHPNKIHIYWNRYFMPSNQKNKMTIKYKFKIMKCMPRVRWILHRATDIGNDYE